MTNISRTTRSVIALLLSVLMIVAVLTVAVPQSAYAVTQDEIDELKRERDEIAAERDAQQEVIDGLEDQQADALETKKALEEKNSITTQQIEINQETIDLYDTIIQEKAAEVDSAKALEDQQLARYRSRVRAMEENGEYDYLALIFNTTSLGELLTVIDDINEIMRSDKELEDAYTEARENTEAVKAEYEACREDAQQKQDELRAEQEALEADLAETQSQIDALQEEISTNQELLDEIEAEWDEANDQVNAKVKELEAERAAAAAAAAAAAKQSQSSSSSSSSSGTSSSTSNVVGTGSFTWPCPSCYYITSRVGYRWHPISGLWKYHSGLDIGASYGATVVAADGGTVSLCEWYGGYGNCIMINHGNGYYTLYGHLSSFAVSYGQSVSKGQTIAYVGSTGNSTGPHLHFEIRSGDTILDPENFFSGNFTYAADAGD